MNKQQLLEHLRAHFRADDARFQNGVLWLKGFYDSQTGILKTDWTETMWTETLCRRFASPSSLASTR